VQTFAVNAMGVFRVADQNVIDISTQDMTELAQNAQPLLAALKQQASGGKADESTDGQDARSQGMPDAAGLLRQYTTPLNSASDFTAFSFKLPSYWRDQTPEITEIDPPAQTVTIDTANLNKALAALQSPVTLPDSLNGGKAAVTPAAAIVAKYADAVCFATRKPSFDLPGNLESAVIQIVTTLPLLPEDIRSQLANIDLFDSNIYLPNVEGVTKTADLGGNTGYIYAADDLTALGGNLLPALLSGLDQPADFPSAATGTSLQQPLQELAGCEIILWVSNNTLYGVAGRYSDDQLAAIARTMQ